MEKKKCPACGREIKNFWKFCVKCGTEIKHPGVGSKDELINAICIELSEAASYMNNSEITTGISGNKVNIGKVRAYIHVLQMLGCDVKMKSQYITKTASYGHVDEIKVDGEPLKIESPDQWRDRLPS